MNGKYMYIVGSWYLLYIHTRLRGPECSCTTFSVYSYDARVCAQNIQINPIMSKVHYKGLVTQIVQTKVSSLPWRG